MPSRSMQNTEADQKRCFVVAPIGDEMSGERTAIDGLLGSVLEPCFSARGMLIEVSHRIAQPGSISEQIIERLVEADIVIAVLTDLNPNVMYELAVRHATRKPVITLARVGTPLPFDVRDERTILYTDSIAGTLPLRTALDGAVDAALLNPEVSNPITRATSSILIRMAPESTDKTTLLLKRLDQIEGRLASMQYPLQADRQGTDVRTLLITATSRAHLDSLWRDIPLALHGARVEQVNDITLAVLLESVEGGPGMIARALGRLDPPVKSFVQIGSTRGKSAWARIRASGSGGGVVNATPIPQD